MSYMETFISKKNYSTFLSYMFFQRSQKLFLLTVLVYENDQAC